ncbi:MAG: glycosyltransferase family 39 protein, partial [Candidatus Bathyarchaeia archaeon]
MGPFSKKTGTWVVLTFVMIVFAIASTMFSMESHMIDYDNACHFYYSVYINEGKIPYRDFSLFKTPLYMYVVSMFFSVFGVGFEQILALNIFINAVTIVGIYLFGREVKNPKVGLVASAFYALSYFSVLIHVAGKTEPLFNLLLVYAILFLVKPRPREPLKSIASPLLLALAFYN